MKKKYRQRSKTPPGFFDTEASGIRIVRPSTTTENSDHQRRTDQNYRTNQEERGNGKKKDYNDYGNNKGTKGNNYGSNQGGQNNRGDRAYNNRDNNKPNPNYDSRNRDRQSNNPPPVAASKPYQPSRNPNENNTGKTRYVEKKVEGGSRDVSDTISKRSEAQYRGNYANGSDSEDDRQSIANSQIGATSSNQRNRPKRDDRRFEQNNDQRRWKDNRKPPQRGNRSFPVNLIKELKELNKRATDSDSQEEGLIVPFDTEHDRPNEGRLIKTKKINFDLEVDEERVLKRAIQSIWSGRRTIRAITDIAIMLDYHYPHIYLEYRLEEKNGSELQLNDLLAFIRYIGFCQYDLREVFRKLYNSNYERLDNQEFSTLLPLAIKRADVLCKTFKGEYLPKERRIIKSLLSVCRLVPNRTVQFSFIDNDHNYHHEINFNNFFVEKYKKEFPKAYELCQKKIASIPLEDGNEKQNDQAVVGDEEMSSDDERPVQAPPNISAIRLELEKLFNENLISFDDKIDEKNDEFQELNKNPNKREEADKLSELISEMDTTLEDYRNAIAKFKYEYETMESSSVGKAEKDSKVYMIYKQLRILRNQLGSELPIISRKRALFNKLDQQSLIILEGETGSGKSTQLPQMLCEYYKVFTNPKAKPIVLTQPRKIAVRSLAERIAFEMDEKVPGFIDYVSSAGKNTSLSSECKIVVKLDRLLLDEIESDRLLEKYSCLVIDEAHERTISIDVIVGLIKKILAERKDFKVIITSATLDSALFEQYFKTKTFKVSGRMYPVTIKYLPFKSKERFVDKIAECIDTEIIAKGSIKNEYRGHILAFCTTVDEINELCDRYRSRLDPKEFVVCPLHGRLDPQQQRKAFDKVGNKIKLVFSSRIAETAITIDKVKVVIDLGQDREMVYDQVKRISSFQLMAISQSAAKQRAGRAGRTSAGFCFRLYEESEMRRMRVNKRPEIEGTPLDIVVLRLKQLNIADVLAFPYLSPPPAENLRQSLETVQLIGCLDQKQEINEIGRTLVKIPMEPLLSRAIVDGLICEQLDRKRRVTSKIIRILAMMVSSNTFYNNEDKKENIEKIKFKDFADDRGDFFSLLNIYQAVEKEKKSWNFCRERYLNKKSLMQAQDLVKQITILITGVTLSTSRLGDYTKWMERKLSRFKDDNDLITSCLLSSFCQNLCLYSGDTNIGYTHIITQTPIQVYGTSFLSLQGLAPDWIVCYDIIRTSKTFCKIGQGVTFEMLRLSVQPSLFEKYRLNECEKSNPFYYIIDKTVPTLMIKDFQQIKWQKDEAVKYGVRLAGLFENCEVICNLSIHRLKIYFVMNEENKRRKENIEKCIQDLKIFYSNKYNYSFLGLNVVEFSTGCKVNKIDLSSQLYTVNLMRVPEQLLDYIENTYGGYCQSIGRKAQSLTASFSKLDDRYCFLSWWNSLQLDPEVRNMIEVTLVDDNGDKMKKIAKGVVKMRFWTAERRKHGQNRGNPSYLILYPKPSHQNRSGQKQQKTSAEKFEQSLYYNVNTLNDLLETEGLQFSVTAAKNGINVRVKSKEVTVSDEYQLEKKLFDLYNEHAALLRHMKIIGWRTVDSNISRISNKAWKKQLVQLLPWPVEAESIVLRSANNDRDCRGDTEYMTDFWAEVETYDTREAERFISKKSGKRDLIGTEKFHAEIVYRQNVMRIKEKIFMVFKARFENLKEQLLYEYPHVEITLKSWTSKDLQIFVYIDCSGPRRHELLEPVKKLKAFICRTEVKVDPIVAKILLSNYDGRKYYMTIFDYVEYEFQWNVYLDFDHRRNEIHVYSNDDDEELEVVEMLRDYLDSLKSAEERISYKGKNIYKVQEILKDYSRKVKSRISFSERCVYISGNVESVIECINEINRIVKEDKQECDICYNILSVPYRMFECGHEFCSGCLLEHIRSLNDDPMNFPLECPSFGACEKYINVHDLRNIFDEEEFNTTCDTAISRLIDNQKYHGCETTLCKQIFEVERTESNKGEYSCALCTLAYCKKCRRTAHLPMTCEEAEALQQRYHTQNKPAEQIQMQKDQRKKRQRRWEQKREEDEEQPREENSQPERKGYFKQCGKCQRKLYRNGNSYKVVCSCKAHVCWQCSQVFKHDIAVSAHLRDKHKLPTD